MTVKVSYPLKQGLKLLGSRISKLYCLLVKVSYPLKQGLKLAKLLPANDPFLQS